MKEHIDVAAAVIRDGRGRVLLGQRPEGKHLAGLWEFPGGKHETGESSSEALKRELLEELGIEVRLSKPLLSLTHDYPEKRVRLWIRTVGDWVGTPVGREGQRLSWFDLDQLRTLPMPAADRPIVKLLGLDTRYVTTPDFSHLTPDGLVSRWQDALNAGFRFLGLSIAGLDEDEAVWLAGRCRSLAHAAGARCLLKGDVELAIKLGADGLHCDVATLRQYGKRPLAEPLLLGVDCNDEEDLSLAGNYGADFVCLPLRRQGKRGAKEDWSAFARRVAVSPVPLIATDSSSSIDQDRARESGAFGIAIPLNEALLPSRAAGVESRAG